MKRGGRLAAVSVKRRATNAQLAESRAIVIDRSVGRCEANTPACPKREHEGVHVHHVLRRSQTGEHDPALMLNVCLAAHEYIHANPQAAYEAGWLLRSWEVNRPRDAETSGGATNT